MIASMLAIAALASLPAAPTSPLMCSVGELRGSPGYRWPVERVEAMVDSASRIVRVRAMSADPLAGTVTFQPLEWVRGGDGLGALTLAGRAVDRDDMNAGPVPYQMVRSAGQRGDCFAQEYRIGAQYLLLLADRAGANPIQWWPLGPVNEQLLRERDPWLIWVRQRAAKPRSTGRGI
jgi:hypothetical protein